MLEQIDFIKLSLVDNFKIFLFSGACTPNYSINFDDKF